MGHSPERSRPQDADWALIRTGRENRGTTIKKLIVGILGAFRRLRLLLLRLRGKTEADISAQRIVSGKSWDEYCDTLKAAGAALVFPGAPTDPFNQAEGYRYLARLARSGLEAFLENADPRAPVLARPVHETVKMGSDNPDNYYQNATISGQYEYRISGTRGTVHYLGFGTQKGNYTDGGGMPPTGYIEASQLQLEPDGSFELLLSCSKPATGNWLPMEPGTNLLIVRQTFADRATERIAELKIERLGGDSHPGMVTPQGLDKGLNTAGLLVAGASMLFAKWARDFQKHTNQLPRFSQDVSNAAGGDPNIAYYHSYWKLAPDEALVIDSDIPDCDAWNFQLDNHWLESLDYRYFTIHVNKFTAKYRPNGSVRVVVAHQDPGIPNWINTVGHDCGVMSWRWIRAKSHPQPEPRVVKLAAVGKLP